MPFDFSDETTRNPKRKCKKTVGGKSSNKFSNSVENSSPPSSQECDEIDEEFVDDIATDQEKIRKNIEVVWTDDLLDASPIEVDESEIPKALKKALLWLANQTKRREIDDGIDDIYEYSKYRYFIGEELQGIIGGIYEGNVTLLENCVVFICFLVCFREINFFSSSRLYGNSGFATISRRN